MALATAASPGASWRRSLAGAAVPLLMGELGAPGSLPARRWLSSRCAASVAVIRGVPASDPPPAGQWHLRPPDAHDRAPSWGMQFAHIGVAVFIIGVALVKGYQSERDVRMFEG
ncbi:MAG: cytochrome c-type biogenesis CcmF C-terminal domain-containing protein [Sutterella wadsworthensis]